ncbi:MULTISPECIES: hypothetical protein [Mycobacteriaceae]|uniref:Lipoprotein n=1 Tax=Mycobacteroides franklinii TaxID=948102 RepID=A0A4R8QW25_9MYCO|nr:MULTISPECIES: hypothetical protein [Mycobacteriaceae]MCV7088489.1 hypothetical protein [Mycolicibacter hiberniae]ORA56897.1 hypothetical protein BST24_24755 [Mycobacteroides franklinii]TDH25004.1 hypothetical protein EJ571_03755 [Mycobacteroides franklinii]TDZ46582.1 hypothetical protein CCUG64054_00406 [Mycobacteroides franklinii]TDZ48091.1 hypothetical protein CCUG63697_04390 [Mycobacteroides franklinii]
MLRHIAWQFLVTASLASCLVPGFASHAKPPDDEPCPHHPVKIDPKCERSGAIREKSPHND